MGPGELVVFLSDVVDIVFNWDRYLQMIIINTSQRRAAAQNIKLSLAV